MGLNSRLISGSYDSVRVWDGSTGAPIAIFEGHSDSVLSLTFPPDITQFALGLDNIVRFLDCATPNGHPQSIYPLPRSPLMSQLASMSVDTILRHCDSDADGSFSSLNIKLDHLLLSKELYMSLCESEDPSRKCYIQGTVPGIGHVPLLWLPVDTVEIYKE